MRPGIVSKQLPFLLISDCSFVLVDQAQNAESAAEKGRQTVTREEYPSAATSGST
jgi:hypothetical protein